MGKVVWCEQRESNSHGLRPQPPQDCVSTNSTMLASLGNKFVPDETMPITDEKLPAINKILIVVE